MKKELYNALWHGGPANFFATGVQPKVPMPASIEVQGLGKFNIPLSTNDFQKLKSFSESEEEASFRSGDQNSRQASQIAAEKLSFPENPRFLTDTSHELAASALANAGVSVGDFNVVPDKMILYESGGHFKFYGEKERGDGVFATMIIQLPVESGHESGFFTVRLGNLSKAFNFRTGTGYFHTIFSSDCNHQVLKVSQGSRVCLVFGLVPKNISRNILDPERTAFVLSALPRVRSLLRLWMSTKEKKLIIPLGHRYLPGNLCFAGLRGHDRVVADLLRQSGLNLELHVCTLTKREVGHEGEIRSSEYWLHNWRSADDAIASLGRWSSSQLGNLVRMSDSQDPFDDVPDEEIPRVGAPEHLFHLAALVLWPMSRRVEVLFSSSLSDVEVARVVMGRHLDRLNSAEAIKDLHDLSETMVQLRRNGAWPLLLEWLCRIDIKSLKHLEFESLSQAIQEFIPEAESTSRFTEAFHLLVTLRSSGHGGAAVKLAEMMVRNVNKLEDEQSIEKVLLFCMSSSSLQNEACKLVGKLPLEFVSLALESGNELYHKILNRRLNSRLLASSSGRFEEAIAVAELVYKLEAHASYGLATAVACKLREMLLWMAITENNLRYSLLLRANPFRLFPFLEYKSRKFLLSCYGTGPEKPCRELVGALGKMKGAARLLRLKVDEGSTETFAEFCLLVLEVVEVDPDSAFDGAEVVAQEEYETRRTAFFPDAKFDLAMELIEVIFWLGDETLIERVVLLVNERTHLAWKLLQKKSGFVGRAMSMGGAARKGLKKVAEGRRSYLISGLEYGKERIGAKRRKICGISVGKLVDDPRLLRTLECVRRQEWETRSGVEVNDIELLLSFLV